MSIIPLMIKCEYNILIYTNYVHLRVKCEQIELIRHISLIFYGVLNDLNKNTLCHWLESR